MLSMGKKGNPRTTVLFVWCSIITHFIIASHVTAANEHDIKQIIDQSIAEQITEQQSQQTFIHDHELEDLDPDNSNNNESKYTFDDDEQIEDNDEYEEYETEDELQEDDLSQEAEEDLGPEFRTINQIYIVGNRHIPTEAILDRIPFLPGEIFQPQKTRSMIRSLYYDLKRFKNITVEAENIGKELIDIYIVVEEKKPLLSVTFTGNTQVTEKEISERINFNDIPTIDEQELNKYVQIIKKVYIDKGYLLTHITPELIEENGKAHIVFHIEENDKSIIKRIDFCGNQNINSKTLRGIMFTREDWILSFMDKAGTYNPEWLERDKHVLEQYYQNNGFINAKVYATDVDMDEESRHIHITVHVDEGDLYHFGTVCVDGADLLSEEFLLRNLPVQQGNLYSREDIVDSIKFLEFMFSDLGFLYTQIEPLIQPNEITKEVDVQFVVDPGQKVFLNKLTIRGNKKTRDKIIRRNIPLEEGNVITNRLMEIGKTKVESLGYFDTRDGVNWKTTRISEDEANLDLLVKEVKTGNAHMKIGFGGPEMLRNDHTRNWVNQLMTGVSVEGNVADNNVAGTGIKFNLTGKLSTKEQDVLLNLTQPWLFDKPIYGSLDTFHRRAAYDQLQQALAMNEQRTSLSGTIGVVTGWRKIPLFNDTYIRYNIGFDRLTYDRNPQATVRGVPEAEQIVANAEYQVVLDKLFFPGQKVIHYGWMNIQLGQDKKNHPMHPSNGHTWMMRGIFAFPSFDSCIGYAKWDLDANWFTPLIGSNALVFRLHGYLGFIKPFRDRLVPYRELFHIGGPASIRGFLFGQIGPQFSVFQDGASRGDSIGAEKTAFINAELIFPIMPDFSFKGLVFYDGGTGWDNPYADDLSPAFLRSNNFEYRHAVGVGLRVLNPMPMKIDWGFKLDPKKGEPGFEVHFAMGYDWQ
ncbi:MAG: outer membrane protein assembly factor BamA [Candidatus Dependentiae bacterium]